MGFHKREIKKGVYGELSKIQEELDEAFDAEEQGQDLMLLIELSDMVGAIEGVAKKYGFTLEQLRAFATLRSAVAIEEEESGMIYGKHFKNFTMITTSYNCDKKCPYCIAKIDKLPDKEENLIAFGKVIDELKNKGCRFDYFVLSGNGEPSLYSYSFLKGVKEIVERSGIFKEKRIQTSGNLFFDNVKFDLFKDWIIEITRVSPYFWTDSKILRYKRDYFATENVKKARLRVNIVLLQDKMINLKELIKFYLNTPNIEIVALKILDNKDNDWITKHGTGYDRVDKIAAYLSEEFGDVEKKHSNLTWNYRGKVITMSNNKDYLEKDLDSLYWYGDDLLKRN